MRVYSSTSVCLRAYRSMSNPKATASIDACSLTLVVTTITDLLFCLYKSFPIPNNINMSEERKKLEYCRPTVLFVPSSWTMSFSAVAFDFQRNVDPDSTADPSVPGAANSKEKQVVRYAVSTVSLFDCTERCSLAPARRDSKVSTTQPILVSKRSVNVKKKG